MIDLPKVIDDDPAVIVAEMVASFEAEAGKTLLPAHVERLLINRFAYRESLVKAGINHAFRQGLVRFAEGPILDYLGELLKVMRLEAKAALTTQRINFVSPLASAVIIPDGTRFETASGIQFKTTAEQILASGLEYADLPVTAVIAGSQASGLLPGQISALIDDISVDVDSVSNLTTSTGGADQELDDRYRSRIQLAPEAFSTGGSRLAYRFHVLSVSEDIVDVTIRARQLTIIDGVQVSNGIPAGEIQLFPLLKRGLPGNELLERVEAACSDERVRPLSDDVVALAPIEYPYAIRARLDFYESAVAADSLASAQKAAEAFAAARSAKLGKDIVPGQISAAIAVDGVYEVVLLEPLEIMLVPENGWANCSLIDIVPGEVISD